MLFCFLGTAALAHCQVQLTVANRYVARVEPARLAALPPGHTQGPLVRIQRRAAELIPHRLEFHPAAHGSPDPRAAGPRVTRLGARPAAALGSTLGWTFHRTGWSRRRALQPDSEPHAPGTNRPLPPRAIPVPNGSRAASTTLAIQRRLFSVFIALATADFILGSVLSRSPGCICRENFTLSIQLPRLQALRTEAAEPAGVQGTDGPPFIGVEFFRGRGIAFWLLPGPYVPGGSNGPGTGGACHSHCIGDRLCYDNRRPGIRAGRRRAPRDGRPS